MQKFCKNGHERTPENVYAHNRQCKLCQSDYDKKHRKDYKNMDPVKYREVHIVGRKLRRHHISLEAYDAMYAKQQGLCALCGTTIVKHERKTHIDHNHRTEEIRGLLCEACNIGLGMFKDCKDVLLKAIEYLSERGTSCTTGCGNVRNADALCTSQV